VRRFLFIAVALASSQAQTFDVASLKAIDSSFVEARPKITPGRLSWTTGMNGLLCFAFQLQAFQLQMPNPMPAGVRRVYRVDAEFAPNATERDVRRMMQALIVERFKIASHRTTKEADVYTLTAAKGGTKIKMAAPDDAPPPFPDWWHNPPSPQAIEGRILQTIPSPGIVTMAGRRVTISQLCETLSSHFSSTVTDATGLTGPYYFAVRYASDDFNQPVDAPSLFAALEKELGLRLDRHKGQLEMLAIDHIERLPVEN